MSLRLESREWDTDGRGVHGYRTSGSNRYVSALIIGSFTYTNLRQAYALMLLHLAKNTTEQQTGERHGAHSKTCFHLRR